MKGKQQQDFRTEKYIRYGIRKYSFGAASVAIAAGLMFLGNGAVSATEVQSAETAISTVAPSQDDKEQPEAKVETVETVETAKSETEKATEVKPEVKVANKATLEAKVVALESKLSNAKYADASVVSSAKDVLATAKATLAKAEVSQVEVDKQVETVVALSTVVAESDAAGLEKKEAADKEAAKAEAEKTATLAEKALSVATTTLTQVSSEAEVTNKLAETELAKADVKKENKAAVTAAVAKNQAVLAETKALLADKSVTKEQVDAQLERLNESILAVYNELKNAGINRDGKFSYVLADIAETVTEPPLSEEEQANHWKKYADKNTERLTKQIKWFDIANSKATVENLGEGDRLKVGTKFTQEISPGYVVTLTVTKLAPFNSTDEYKKRGGAGYDANAQNVYKDGTPAELKVVTQGGYSVAKTNGMDTRGKTVIQSVVDGANVGVEFSVKSTLNGKEVPSNVVFLTGEEAGSSEVEIYKTDGDGFELVTELSNTTPQYSTARSYIGEIYERRTVDTAGHGQNRVDGQLGISYTLEGSDKPAFAPFLADKGAGFFNTTVTSDTVITATAKDGTIHADGLGTQVFGPVSTHRESGFSTPLVMTRNAKNIGMYILSAGQQGSMLGFMVLDEGDAPASYGRVAHSISKSDGQKQPYLGSVPADVDVRTTPINKTNAFVYDDINGIGAADEGARQLMGDDVAPNDNYKLKKVNDGTYSMTFDAHLDGEAKAYVNGWIDFNNNGKFDEGEGAGVTEVTQDGKVTLTWTNDYQNVDTSVTKLATRLRIAYDKADVKEATGIAYSGEVEDFQIQQTVPPRGTKRETTDVQGATQTSTVAFNAYGQKNYDFDKDNAIDTTVKSQIVKPDGTLVTDADLVDGYYVVPGQGKYKITDNGANVDVEFIPEANFVGTADGITIRRTDINGNTTGWGNEGRQIVGGEGDAKDQLELVSEQVQLDGLTVKGSMDGRYIPTVTPKEIVGTPEESTDIQGKPQTKTPKFSIDVDKDGDGTAPDAVTPSAQYPAKLVDPATGKPTDETTVTVKGEGTYTIDPTTGAVTFTPEPQFTGTAKGIDVSLTAPVGQDKNGQPATATATAKYTPTVTGVTPTAEPSTSTGIQGETQKGIPTFTAGNTEVPIKENSVKLLNADGTEATGPVDALDEKGNKVGEYTVNPATGEVTFTPTDKTYTGKVVPAKVQAEDKNGTKVSTTYTPNIVGVTPTATPDESTGVQGETQEGTVSFAPGETTIGGEKKSVPIKANSAKLLNADGSEATGPVDALDEKGNKVGEYTIDPATNKVTFTPTDKTYVGKVQPAKVQAEDENGTKVQTTYTPTIVGVTPTADPAETTDVQGVEQSKEVTFKPGKATVNGVEKEVPLKTDSFTLLDENGQPATSVPAKNPAGDVIGTYTLKVVDGKATAVFTPTDKTYAGEVEPVTIQAKDTNGTPVTTTYTPNITPVEPTGTPTTSEGAQGQTQEGTPTFTQGNDKVPMKIDNEQPAKLIDPATGNPTDETTIPAKDAKGNTVGTYTIEPTTGKVTFTPNKDFVGTPVPATVQAKDANGTPTTATYTPTVTPVVPTAEPAETTDIQGKEQTGKPTFTPGADEVPMDDDTPATFEDGSKEKVIPGEGTYTVAPDGTVIFTPEKNFTGKGTGVTVKRVDKNGTPVTATYTPTVTPVTPTADPAETTDIQGKEQTGKPTFTPGNPNVPMDDDTPATFEDGSKEKVIPGEGTYTVAPDGTVTFTPEKNFTGKGTGVTVKRVDKNGTPVTAKYTPTVAPVTPTGTDAITEDVQGSTQTGKPTFEGGKVTVKGEEKTVEIDEDKPAKLVDPKTGNPVDSVTIEGEGTYTVAPDGTVTFTPEKNFTGKGTGVTVQREDKNGTPVTAKYTPVVKPATPTSSDVITTNVQGATQSGTPTFEGGKVTVNGEEKTVEIDKTVKPTFDDGTTEKKVPGEGTYTIDENGKVTFTPEKTFTGQATGVTVKRVDKNGTPVTAKYTPVVVPVTPTSKDTESEGPKGQPQSGTPTFEGGKVTINGKEVPVEIDETVKPTFDDGTTEKKVPGEGTYTIDENGKVTFTPEPDFVGKATGVTVKRVDKNGTPVTATYTPTVRPDTSFVDKDGNPLSPTEDGTKPTKDIPGYKIVKTEVDEKGNTKHIYEKVKTSFKDKEGNEIPGNPSEDGEQPKKDIPGYRFVETKKLPNGDTEHVYEKVKTSFKDKEGNEIPGNPSEDGEQPKKDIPGYRFVETKKLPNGDTEHVYEKVKTSFKDKEGNEIPGNPSEDGDQPKKDIPGYRFVETKKLPDGDTEHVYEKVKTSFKDKEGNEIPGNPSEDGDQPKKDIPGYRFVETKKLPNGDTEHVYEKVKTSFKDKEGNEIPGNPSEDGDQPKKDIPGYRFVETKKLPNGDTEHVYEKVKTSFKDKEGNEIPNYPTEDGEQPKKDIPGYRFVETKKLPNGDIEHVYEKISTPLIPQTEPYSPTPTPVTEKVLTTYVDENGELIIPDENGSHPGKSLEGYELVRTETDDNGNVRNVYRKIQSQKPVQPVEPATPAMPEQPAKPQVPATPAQPVQATAVKEAEAKRELPNTGTEDNARLAALGLLGVLSGFGLVSRKKKED
ncbi:Ig-like domain-containing protein [Streptococcus mitis]|uniref:Endo-beta-N-acetylglucosaminidase n=1 Tax=Streptococcus mitis TaxID=28037 RepID=A0A0F2DEX1_STRMT|nr:GEVED domain-containing protein [Streptococcus mitis]KJQ69567.1 endo-beta-N-acetylglucosaminidase [Streptococcus mitis]